jgi:hypothetical protein
MMSAQLVHDDSLPDEAELEDLHLSPTENSQVHESLIPLDNSALRPRTISKSAPTLTVSPTIKDLKFIGIFAVHCLITVVAVLTSSHDTKDTIRGVPYVGIMVIVSTVYSLLWVYMFFRLPKDIYIRMSTIASFVGIAPMTLMLFISPSWLGLFVGVSVAIIAFSDWLWTRKNKLGFDFVAVVFDLVATVLMSSSAVIAASIVVLFVASVWAFWCCQLLANVEEDEGWSFNLVWMLFHFYWVSHLFKTIIAVFVSGTVMFWYHHWDSDRSESPRATPSSSWSLSPSSTRLSASASTVVDSDSALPARHVKSTPPHIVVGHYVRVAFTSAFGASCIGSLMTPLAHLVWNLLRMSKREDAWRWLRVCVRPYVGRIESFIQVYHKYTFVYVASYGQSFHAASVELWHLIDTQGIEAMVDDDLTSRLLLFAANGCAGCMGALANGMLFGSHLQLYGTILSYFVGYSVCSTATTMMNSTVKTLFVCFAMNPTRLSKLNPIIYHRFVRLSELKNFKERR